MTVTDNTGCTGTFGPLDVIGPMAPDLISTSVTGSCPDGSTGSMTLELNQVDSIIVTGPGGTYFVDSTNPYAITNTGRHLSGIRELGYGATEIFFQY